MIYSTVTMLTGLTQTIAKCSDILIYPRATMLIDFTLTVVSDILIYPIITTVMLRDFYSDVLVLP